MKSLVMVSNRLPLRSRDGDQEGYQPRLSAGGLATALRAVARQRPVRWIGWNGGVDSDPNVSDIIASSADLACDLVPVYLSDADRREFYCGFCNEIIWPLFHGLPPTSSFEPSYWKRYMNVNVRYADAICREASSSNFVWVHDYHLMLQGKLLGSRLDRDQLAFFLHIPFPPADVFASLPWKLQLLDSLLLFGTIGLQTALDCQNFLSCVRTYIPQAQIRSTISGTLILRGGSSTVVRHCPISIDFDEFAELAMQPEIAIETERIRREANVRRLVLGVDRLDYTKGIPERLEAFRDLLSRYPGLRQEIGMIQVVVPSREEIPSYQKLKNQVEDLVKAINQQFGTGSWVPVRYEYGHLSREQLVAHYRAADIALVTPLKDGMNLVAKEFCASRVDESGILILSEFAGAAVQLGTGAYLVNPRHTHSIVSALHNAIDAEQGDIGRRMRRMRRNVKRNDIQRWCNDMLAGTAAFETEVIARKRAESVRMPDSWQMQIPGL